MPDTPQLLMFIAAGWLLNLTPGPDVLYIVSNALKSGVRAGIVAALGIVSGCFVHVFAAALGVSALLATSATAFTVLKWIGAAYLMWMGVKLLFAQGGGSSIVPADAARVHQPATCAASTGAVSSPTCSTPRSRCSSWPSCRSSSRPVRPTR
ncbi:Leucine efflux protein [Hydrogenophaga sp. T4]|nr:Leucine efflux protein [Hydrogenophaga sp. T4]